MIHQQHSRLGILSFVFAIFAALMALGLIVVIALPMANSVVANLGSVVMLDGALLVGIGMCSLLSIATGIYCMLQKDRQRTYGTIGLLVSLGSIILTGGIVAWVTLA